MKHDHNTHTSHPISRSALILALAFVAVFVTKGCVPQPYYPPPQPINTANGQAQQVTAAPTYANPPTAGVPYGSVVVTEFGGVIPRYAPIPTHYQGSPGEAAWRNQGEAIARSDYAGVGASAPPVPGRTGQNGGTGNGNGQTNGDLGQRVGALEDQQLDTHTRVRRLERQH